MLNFEVTLIGVIIFMNVLALSAKSGVAGNHLYIFHLRKDTFPTEIGKHTSIDQHIN